MNRRPTAPAVSIILAALTTSACMFSVLPAYAGWETRTVSGSNVHVYTPASRGVAGTGRGLIIGLHGCVQTNDALRDRGNWESAAEAFGIVIALPKVPNGGVLAGCWDYYGADHMRSGRHDGFVLQLASELTADGALAIDSDQVYIAGLSSGAGEAAVIACLAPDVFAGVGINAGPAVGTSVSEASVIGTTSTEAARDCERLAGANAGDFATQLASVIAGTGDFIVAQGYNRMNAEALAAIYAGDGAALTEAALDVSGLRGYQPDGQGSIWSDARGARISLIIEQGMGHAFPAGSGAGAEINFIASEGVDWPYYLAELFTTNNRRVASGPGPGPGTEKDAGTTGPARDGSTGRPSAPDAGGSMIGQDAGAAASGDPDPADSGCLCVRSAAAGDAELASSLGLLSMFALSAFSVSRARRHQ